MQQILRFYLEICLLRTGPHRAPTAVPFITFLLGIYLVLTTISLLISREDFSLQRTLAIISLGLAAETSCIWALLTLKNVADRFRATFVTLLGTSTLFNVAVTPLNWMLLNTESSPLTTIAITGYWILLGWWLLVAGFVLHRAIRVSIIRRPLRRVRKQRLPVGSPP